MTARLLALLIGSIVAFVLAETGLRLGGFEPWTRRPAGDIDMPLHERSATRGWQNKPGFHVWTEKTRDPIRMTFRPGGFRATSKEGESDRPVVLVLGGSFSQGWAVPDADTYAWRLQERHPEFEFLNLGTAAYGTYQSLLAFEEYLAAGGQAPKIVIYGFFEHHVSRNVAGAAWLRGLSQVSDDEGVCIPYVTMQNGDQLARHEPTAHPAWILKESSSLITLLEARYVDFATRERSQQADEAMKALLLELRDAAREHGASLMAPILVQPTGGPARHTLPRFMRRSGIVAPNCTPPDWGNPRLLVPGYGHPNARANAYWADCIDRALTRLIAKAAPSGLH